MSRCMKDICGECPCERTIPALLDAVDALKLERHNLKVELEFVRHSNLRSCEIIQKLESQLKELKQNDNQDE